MMAESYSIGFAWLPSQTSYLKVALILNGRFGGSSFSDGKPSHRAEVKSTTRIRMPSGWNIQDSIPFPAQAVGGR